jgi:hypothetical protein
MKPPKLILKILIFFGITILLVGCSQASEPQEVAEEIESPPTETRLPPTPTEIPPTATEIPPTKTQVPPTETEAPPTETPTTAPTKVLTEQEFTEGDLLGLWTSEKQPNMSMSFEENGLSKLFERGLLAGEIADYELKGDVLNHTLGDCTRMVGGAIEFFTCSADYRITYFMDEDNQAYLGFELIGEDEHSFRRMMFGSGALWVKD